LPALGQDYLLRNTRFVTPGNAIDFLTVVTVS
jgi:hypothetical protein